MIWRTCSGCLIAVHMYTFPHTPTCLKGLVQWLWQRPNLKTKEGMVKIQVNPISIIYHLDKYQRVRNVECAGLQTAMDLV